MMPTILFYLDTYIYFASIYAFVSKRKPLILCGHVISCCWLLEWWASEFDASPAGHRKGFSTVIILTEWSIWKGHNACIFDAKLPSVPRLTMHVQDRARLWARAGATALNSIIPEI